MGLSEENRQDVVAYRIERAFIALDQAKKNLQINCLEVTANRLYYAAYYAASKMEPTEAFIIKVTELAKQKIEQ